MENASLVGLSRQIALQRELDVVANNVANLNTTGYKADNVVFHEHLMPVARANQFRPGDRQISFVQDRATWLDLSQGPVQQTGNPLDIAVSDNAFLTVQTPRGRLIERIDDEGRFSAARYPSDAGEKPKRDFGGDVFEIIAMRIGDGELVALFRRAPLARHRDVARACEILAG